ncbi:MAG TPA: hypothetical protein VML91_22845 [Burkholderiales bacterium]|nr:hypothetical protein [Burkholderiales bacterium]
MRDDHVFYGHTGGRHPTADEIEYHVHAAHRLRAEALHELLHDVLGRLAGLLRRRPAAKLQTG